MRGRSKLAMLLDRRAALLEALAVQEAHLTLNGLAAVLRRVGRIRAETREMFARYDEEQVRRWGLRPPVDLTSGVWCRSVVKVDAAGRVPTGQEVAR